MKICNSCGLLSDDNSYYCEHCGMQFVEPVQHVYPEQNMYSQKPQQNQSAERYNAQFYGAVPPQPDFHFQNQFVQNELPPVNTYKNTMAIVVLVISIIMGGLPCLASIILSVLSLTAFNRCQDAYYRKDAVIWRTEGESSKRYAKIALILLIIVLAIAVLSFIAYLVFLFVGLSASGINSETFAGAFEDFDLLIPILNF